MVLENHLLLRGIFYAVLDFVRELFCLEVYQTACVFPVFKDMHNGIGRPLALIAGVVAAGAARPTVFQRPRREDLLLCECLKRSRNARSPGSTNGTSYL